MRFYRTVVQRFGLRKTVADMVNATCVPDRENKRPKILASHAITLYAAFIPTDDSHVPLVQLSYTLDPDSYYNHALYKPFTFLLPKYLINIVTSIIQKNYGIT